MDVIADVLLAAGAFGAGFYCFVLQRRLVRFNHLEHGMGGAVAVLSAQVDDLTRVMRAAQVGVEAQALRLDEINARADAAAVRLELLMSSLHDLPEPAPRRPAAEPPRPAPPPASETSPAVRRIRFSRARQRGEMEAVE